MPDRSKFQLHWIPQVPMKPFIVNVATREEGKKVSDILADYDRFQFENKIKPDYCNDGYILFSHPIVTDGEWQDVSDDDDWEDSVKQLNALAPVVDNAL